MPGENGRGRPPEANYHESTRQKELREMGERANLVIRAAYKELRERFECPSDERVDQVLTEMLLRDADEVPAHLRPYMGWDITEIPETVYEETRDLLKMPFHNEAHSTEVVDRTRLILEEMQNGGVEITAEEFELGRMSAAWHDWDQRWKTVQHDSGKLERKRFVGENERSSADALLQELRSRGFVDVDEELVRAAFEATVPGWDAKNGTVEQGALHADSHPVVRAVALADLGAAGLDPDSYIKGGNQLFVEENLDMLHLDFSTLDQDQKDVYEQRMLGWSESQIGFARGRKARFEEELGNLPETAKEELRKLFNKFDKSIARAEEHYARRRAMSVEDLYAVMGFV